MSFVSKSMAPDGVPQYFLSHQGWTADTKTLENFDATPALGVDVAVRARLPKLDSKDPMMVGKWYCPFIFIRDGEVGAQMRDSVHYQMTLQQIGMRYLNAKIKMATTMWRWMFVLRGRRGALLAAERVVVSDGFMWFCASSEVGLSMAVVERVKWEEERVGLACTSSKEEETSSKCCYTVPDPPPQLFDPKNEYQQFQISDYIYCGGTTGFVSNSMAPDGVPPLRLSRNGWRAYSQPLNNFLEPTQALGLNASLRACLPDLDFSLPCKSSNPVTIGKWYCPFIFILEGNQAVGSQMTNSPYYEITLHQNWVEICSCENNGAATGNVDVFV
ncbi:unnamed protein product [Citrullus colocynthis]|uniref:Uncharacterized protein n=1 Tax=Citrullus colocynthis TaxID=252529 RepID=A0ABP0YAU1_9ROSI